MKSMRLFSLTVLFPTLCLLACSGKTDERGQDNLAGKWIAHVADGAFIGNDTMSFSPDFSFKECKGLIYSSSDSGFDFSVEVNIGIEGHWCLKKDSLVVIFDPRTLRISTDKKTFRVSAAESKVNADLLSGVRDSMYSDLDSLLSGMLKSEYAPLLGKELLMGKIEHLDSHNLLLSSGKSTVILSRCAD